MEMMAAIFGPALSSPKWSQFLRIRHGKDVYRDLERAVGCRDVRNYVRPSKRWESAQPLG